MDSFYEAGAHVWLLEGNDWVPATVTETSASQTTFRTHYEKTYTIAHESLNRDSVVAMHQTSIDGVDDMGNLADLHNAAILHNIHIRYTADKIYTYIGSILCAINPYDQIEGLYDKSVMESYKAKHVGEMPPHIFAIANECYYDMWQKGENQCVLISGESGAGKTESTKLILKYLSGVSRESGPEEQSSGGINVEEAILQSSPIMEAFGNAKTVYNNNSSRFGKFIHLQFSKKGKMTGGSIQDFLLEKNRVVRQNPGERNYHIFYSMLAGASESQRDELLLYPAEKYHYLKQSGCISDPSINDKEDFHNVVNAMKVMAVTDEDIADVLQVVAGVLQLGNVSFVAASGAQVADRSVLENVANLLQVDIYGLNDALTMKSRILRGEEIQSPLSVEQADDSRDSMAMNLYACTFKWLIGKINSRVKSRDSHSSIGVLDIFGFENFDVNRFEQFNINYANEKLQQYFNKHIFSLEQHEYNREGIDWKDIDWVDNGECLDLIEKKLGVLSLIDEESNFPKGTDTSMLEKLHSSHEGNAFYLKPRVANVKFGIKHYAGEVFYNTKGFLEKNRDTFREEVLAVLMDSRSDFVYDIVEPLKLSPQASNSKSRKRTTVSSQFKSSLASLMTTLGQSHPYFVRCLKPNSKKLPQSFEPKLVLAQLKYSGMLETVRIRRAGFPVRLLFDDFLFRYKVLLRGKAVSGSPQQDCVLVLQHYDPSKQLFKLGKTKVFLKDHLQYSIERERNAQLEVVAMVIKKRIMGYLQRKKYLKTRSDIILIQKNFKAHFHRKKFHQLRQAVIVFQKYERRRVAQILLKRLLEEKRIEEERRREEERRKEEERRREMERLEQERKLQELEELRRKAEEEARRKEEEEKERRRVEEEQKQVALAKARALEEARRAEEEAKRKAEEEARRKAEEEERLRLEEEARLRAEEEERKRKQEEAEAEAHMAELDRQLKLEEMEIDEEDEAEESEGRPPSIYEPSEGPCMDGFLMMRDGRLSLWKKHWCVLRDDTFMWFRGKQDALKCGWLMKKGGGTTTLSRRNWKRRWFVLKDNVLTYHESDQEGAKALGVIDIRKALRIVDDGVKENGFSIATEGRTYHVIAESTNDWNQWFNILNRVNKATEEELKGMSEETANVKHAVGTIDVNMIESCTTGGVANKPNSFTLITANRVMNFIADSVEDMNSWVQVIEESKEREAEEGFADVIEKGWMVKEGANDDSRRKRWFVLTGNSLDYYKSYVKNSPKFGSIILNSLCSVIPPEEKEGDWVFTVNGRKRSYVMHTKSHEEANRWAGAIQEVIDTKPLIETPFEKIVTELKNANPSDSDVEQKYRINPILKYSKIPLKQPLLAVPYGYSQSSRAKGKGYGSFQEEAIRIFNSLKEQESMADPIPVIQGILQTCQDLKPLRDEVFCQLIKQTTQPPSPDSIGNLRNMQVLVCMCCTFVPTRKYLRYLRFHLRRNLAKHPDSEMAKFANFCLECIKRTRPREYPPSREEIIALLGRRELAAVVHCYGGGSCKISINSATTAGEVVERLCAGLNLDQKYNIFTLFEKCGSIEKNVEDRTVLADIISKFERYKALGLKEVGHRWRLFFKVFCFLEPERPPTDSVEFGFLYEQALDTILQGRYPAPDATVYLLAALRLQFSEGDYNTGAWVSDLDQVFPMGRLKQRIKPDNKPGRERTFSLKGTLRKAVTPFKAGVDPEKAEEDHQKETEEEELSFIKSSICEQWKKFQGVNSDEAQQKYMEIVRSWHGYGSTLFDVESKDPSFPSELWLGVSLHGVAIYKRGDGRTLCAFSYENILSFGAPASNVYKVIVDGREPMIFETPLVIEIAKLMKAYINEIVKRRRSTVLGSDISGD